MASMLAILDKMWTRKEGSPVVFGKTCWTVLLAKPIHVASRKPLPCRFDVVMCEV